MGLGKAGDNMKVKSKVQVFGTKGEDANCNLCNSKLKMSQAHVPPKSCVEQNKRGRGVSHYFWGEGKYNLQNGIHFYTLCKSCNGKLGDPFDKELASFSRTLRSKIHLFKYLPNYSWGIDCKPNLIARSLVGAFLTGSRGCIDASHRDLQHYILNTISGLPGNLKVGFWLHPYDSVIVKPDFIMAAPKRAPRHVLFIMKYFPLAWILYYQDEGTASFCKEHNIHDFSQYLSTDVDSISRISVYPKKYKHQYWPSTSDNIRILIGENVVNNAVLGSSLQASSE
ncbi:MAG: hypothetical protein HND56_00360 [Pseudomonadota bacterium]|nr:hypothetical protein [Pseudomonadota bacterium]QKK04225.1 MAG: hypothetical protein HND56_00360 [Pseudomonadota bacterium]